MPLSDSLISIIIPTLNEERALPGTIDRIRRRAEAPTRLEIIVADGGSTDNTRDTAQRHGAIVVTDHPPPAHRAAAMNMGAGSSVGTVQLFLHADVRVPRRFNGLIRDALRDQSVVGGVFSFAFEYINLPLWLGEKVRWLRYRLRGAFYGDQGVFVRREAFERVGGFPDVMHSEERVFGRALREQGRLVMLKKSVRVSVRHYLRRGCWRGLFRDLRWWWREDRGGDTTDLGERIREEALERAKVIR